LLLHLSSDTAIDNLQRKDLTDDILAAVKPVDDLLKKLLGLPDPDKDKGYDKPKAPGYKARADPSPLAVNDALQQTTDKLLHSRMVTRAEESDPDEDEDSSTEPSPPAPPDSSSPAAAAPNDNAQPPAAPGAPSAPELPVKPPAPVPQLPSVPHIGRRDQGGLPQLPPMNELSPGLIPRNPPNTPVPGQLPIPDLPVKLPG
jgi:hypothetical protein